LRGHRIHNLEWVDARDENVDSKVKLETLEEHRRRDVLLRDKVRRPVQHRHVTRHLDGRA